MGEETLLQKGPSPTKYFTDALKKSAKKQARRLLQTPRPAFCQTADYCCVLHAQIGRAHFFALQQVGGAVAHDNAAVFHNVAPVGNA